MYVCHALILSGNNNWLPIIDLIGSFFIFVKVIFMEHKQELEKLYLFWKNCAPILIESLENSSASPRLYFRIYSETESFIGVYNADIKENRAFFHFTNTFKIKGIQVPDLYCISENEKYYLLEDLGDLNLLAYLKKHGESEFIIQLYKKAIDELLKLQIYGNEEIDFKTFAYPSPEFDSRSILWDLNYFKYYFLKISGITFDEQLLENDFQSLANIISRQPWKGFMFRDFQARNIHIRNDQVWFIDYQGGRKGPMLYDLVSLLYQASANLSTSIQEELKNYYEENLTHYFHFSHADFEQTFYSLALIRITQTLGTYGFRGLIEKKPYFINSIPSALNNLDKVIHNQHTSLEIPYFIHILKQVSQLKF